MLAALAINRTGGLVRSPGAKPEAVHARDFMWEPPPLPPEPELTPLSAAYILGGGFKIKKPNNQ